MAIEPWKVVGSRVTYRDRWLSVRSDDCVTTAGHEIAPYHVLEFPHWVNVVAVTDQAQVVLVRQYRHGYGATFLGLPCGAVEPSDESCEVAGRRELLEEAGYEAPHWINLGSYPANPANQTNDSALFLAAPARHVPGARVEDAAEEIEVELVDLVDLLRNAANFDPPLQVSHVAALWLAASRLAAGAGGLDESARQSLRCALLGDFSDPAAGKP